MSRFAQIIALLCVFLLSSAFGRAESYTHNFSALWAAEPRALAFGSKSTLGIVSATPAMTYTVSGSSFAYTDEQYVINLSSSSAYVTTSVAVENLTRIAILRLASGENMRVWYSTTSNTGPWTEITGVENIKYESTSAEVYLPTTGDYFLKIGCTSAVNIAEIKYYVSSCNCFRLVIE